MKLCDLVKNLNSEGSMLGIIVGWNRHNREARPIVLWADGRCNWIGRHLAEVVNEYR